MVLYSALGLPSSVEGIITQAVTCFIGLPKVQGGMEVDSTGNRDGQVPVRKQHLSKDFE